MSHSDDNTATKQEGESALTPPPNSGGDDKVFTPPKQGFEEVYPFDWRTKFRTDAVSMVEKWSEDFGISKFALDSFVRDNMDNALTFINANVISPNSLRGSRTSPHQTGRTERVGGHQRGRWTPQSPEDFEQIWNAGIAKFSMMLGFDLQQAKPDSSSGSGSRGPSSQDIRNMFDEDQLTEAANSIWQSRLVEDASDARGMAKAYINEMVRSRGERKIDFEQFILNKVEGDIRHDLIYSNKPEGVSDLSHIQPYVQAAMQAMGGTGGLGQQMSDVAVGGAALGASAGAFQQRLARTSANQNSQGFINGLEDRVAGVSNLLRG